MTLKMKLSENIAGNGEIGNLFFPQYFLTMPIEISKSELHLSSANTFNLGKSTFLLFGKELESDKI